MNLNAFTQVNKSKGFTLIELLVVIAIIGLLSSVVLASLNNARSKSRDTRRVLDIKEMQKALELYYTANGRYPVNLDASGAYYGGWYGTTPGCYGNSGGVTVASGLVSGKYISALPMDPKPIGGSYCYLYVATPNGVNYKFLVYNSVENPVASFLLNDPGYTSVTPCDTSRGLNSYAVYSDGGRCF